MNQKPKWLENIQNNSWEPELFISGGIVFSLLQIPDLLYIWGILLLQQSGYFESLIIARILTIAVNGLIVGFILHLIIRGFWVASVCLSYVFPKGIQQEKLEDYQPVFQNKLKKIANTVDFVVLLETLSSLVFALSFLFVLVLLGIFVTLLILIPHSSLVEQIGATPFLILRIGSIISLGIALLYVLDFLTLGKLKKIKWFARFYLPIYTVFSWLSLSPIYRSAYYTLVTNIKSWKLSVVILIYAAVALIFTATTHPENEDFINYKKYLRNNTVTCIHSPNHYDNLRSKKELIGSASIQSEFVSGKFLRVFVVHHKIFERIKDLNCGKIDLDNMTQKQGKQQLQCLSQVYRLEIDKKPQDSVQWRFHQHPKTKEIGLLTVIPIHKIAVGEHLLQVKLTSPPSKLKRLQRYGLMNETFAEITFWKE